MCFYHELIFIFGENMQIPICIKRKIIFQWNEHILLSARLWEEAWRILAVSAWDFTSEISSSVFCDEQEIWIVDLFI